MCIWHLRLNSLSGAAAVTGKAVENALEQAEIKVSGYLDLAERQAEREIPMTMEDWAKYLDGILTSTEENLLKGNGTIRFRMKKICY